MKEKGFINAILLVVATLVILGYYKIDVKTIIDSPTVHDNLMYAGQLVTTGLNFIINKIPQ